jgi:hypothetical protein
MIPRCGTVLDVDPFRHIGFITTRRKRNGREAWTGELATGLQAAERGQWDVQRLRKGKWASH